LDSESASSVNKRQFNHTNFVFINAKFINISEIKEFFFCFNMGWWILAARDTYILPNHVKGKRHGRSKLA
jgi:hypothetical protein